jgi:hypothetical protein
MWNCPAHPDATASLRVSAGEDGRALVHCFAGCATEAILERIGLTVADLFESEGIERAVPGTAPTPPAPIEVLGPPTRDQVAALVRAKRITRRDTLELLGVERVRVWGRQWLRIPAIGASKCWWLGAEGQLVERRNHGPVSVVLSPDLLPKSARATRLWDLEGESDLLAWVDAGGLAAFASTGGAASLAGHDRCKEMLLALRPAEVIVVRDLDDAGRDGAKKAAAWWLAQGVPVRMLELPAELGASGDLRDYLLGRTARDGAPAREPLGGPADLDALADVALLRSPALERGGDQAAEEIPRPRHRLVSLAEVTPQPVSWLWRGRVPRGKLTILDGDPGLGKSAVTLDLAARVSTGRSMPDGTAGPFGDVLLLSYEDDLADTIRPRLDAARADAARVYAFKIVGAEGEGLAAIPRDLAALEAAIVEREVVLVVVDPLMAALPGSVDAHRDQDVRRALAPLAKVAERTRAAIVVVRHLNKGGAAGTNPLYRGGGSIGIIGAARSGLVVARDPQDPHRRVLACTKSNLAAPVPALGFRVVPDAATEAIAVEWLGATQHSAEELLALPLDRDERSARDEAQAFLADQLRTGPRLVKYLRQAARAAGITDRTLDRARHELGVIARRDGFGPGSAYVWAPPARHARQHRGEVSDGEHGGHGEHGEIARVSGLSDAAVAACSPTVGSGEHGVDATSTAAPAVMHSEVRA